MSIYKKKFIDGIFNIDVKTDDINLLRLIDGQLDFPGANVRTKPRFNISFLIVRNPDDRQKFMYSGWNLKKTKMVSSFGMRIADVEVDHKLMSVKVEFCGDWEPCKENFLDFIFFQPIRVILEYQGYLYLHGAALDKEDTCVFITGNQGSGKSTLSLTLAQGGFKFLCDDDCFIGLKSGLLSVLPLRTKIGVKENTLKKWPHLRTRIIKNYTYGGKKRFSLKDEYSDQIDQQYAKYVILFPKYDEQKKMSLVPLSPKETLTRIVRKNLMAHPAGRESTGEMFFVLYALTRKARAFELGYSDKDLNQVCPKIMKEIK